MRQRGLRRPEAGGRPRETLVFGDRLEDEEQRLALRNPTLRNSAALVMTMCVKNPSLTPRIRRAFADLVEGHPDLARFYVQLPADPAVADLRRAG